MTSSARRPLSLAFLLVAAIGAADARAQFLHTYSAAGSLPIPSSGTGGAPGGTANAANRTTVTANVPDAFVVESVTAMVNLNHAAVGDLVMVVSHCGTSVTLYNQSPASTADLSGSYTFASGAAGTFASAISATPPNGTVPSGTYAPAGALGAFTGMSSAGPWTLTIYDLAAGNTGVLYNFVLNFSSGPLLGFTGQAGTIPDGSGGVCLSPLVQTCVVPTHGLVRDLLLGTAFTHPYIGDLDITVQHGNVTAYISQWASPSSSADAAGTYNWFDGAPTAWTAAEASYSGSQVIPMAAYRPKDPFAAFKGYDQFGLWTVTICDRSAFDVGSTGYFWMAIENSSYDLNVAQPSGAAFAIVTNSGGVEGHAFANLITVTQGLAPNGWLGGLDMTLADALNEFYAGPPFSGLFGPCGTTTVTVPGPIPSGLDLWVASFELDAGSNIVALERAFPYHTP